MPRPAEETLVAIYQETIRPLYRYVSRRVGGDTGLAEDLVQETWMRALDAWPSSGVPNEPLAWLTRVARNTLIDHFRRIQPAPVDPATLNLEAEAFRPDDPGAATIVGWGLARLRRPHAEILEAFYFGEQAVRDIAAARGLSERAVEGRLRRARLKLKKVLKKILRAPATRGRTVEEGPDAQPTRTS